MQALSDLPRVIAGEVAKAAPTAAAVATTALLAHEVEWWLKILMYASTIAVAVVQVIIGLRGLRGDRGTQAGGDAP
jgi:hypothetical protein